MTIRASRNNFSGGVISPTLKTRYDLPKYGTACVEAKNVIMQLHGGVRSRPGLHMLEELSGETLLMPFQFNSVDTMTLVWSDQKLRIIDGWGWVKLNDAPYEVVSPYAAADLPNVHYVQMGDVMYFACAGYAPQRLARVGLTDWTLAPVNFGADIDAPSANLTATWSGQSGGTYEQRYKVASVNANGEVSLGSAVFSTTTAYPGSEWQVGDHIALSWDAVDGATEYNIYKERAGYYGLAGISESTTWRDDNYTPDTSDTVQVAHNPFDNDNHPHTLTMHDQRLIFAASAENPNTFWGSRVGDFHNFNKSRPTKDDDAVEFMLATSGKDAIQWLSAMGKLLIGTEGSEHKAQGSGGGVITPASVDIEEQSAWGSTHIQPIRVGTSVLHVQSQGSRVRDLFYSLDVDGYTGNDLSILAEHLFDGHTIKQWAYQQAPDSVLWCIRDDGVLIAMTYLKEHSIWGWHVHETDGTFESVCAVSGQLEDEVFFVVKRNLNGTEKRFVERLATKWRLADGLDNAFFLDCARTYDGTATTSIPGLDYFPDGTLVSALADGSPLADLVVSGGTVTLPSEASKVHVGLPYTCEVAPTSFEGEGQSGSSLGAVRGYARASVVVHETVGCMYGMDMEHLHQLPVEYENYDEAVPAFSGVVALETVDGYDRGKSLHFVQKQPLPMTVLAMIQEVEYGQD